MCLCPCEPQWFLLFALGVVLMETVDNYVQLSHSSKGDSERRLPQRETGDTAPCPVTLCI